MKTVNCDRMKRYAQIHGPVGPEHYCQDPLDLSVQELEPSLTPEMARIGFGKAALTELDLYHQAALSYIDAKAVWPAVDHRDPHDHLLYRGEGDHINDILHLRPYPQWCGTSSPTHMHEFMLNFGHDLSAAQGLEDEQAFRLETSNDMASRMREKASSEIGRKVWIAQASGLGPLYPSVSPHYISDERSTMDWKQIFGGAEPKLRQLFFSLLLGVERISSEPLIQAEKAQTISDVSSIIAGTARVTTTYVRQYVRTYNNLFETDPMLAKTLIFTR